LRKQYLIAESARNVVLSVFIHEVVISGMTSYWALCASVPRTMERSEFL